MNPFFDYLVHTPSSPERLCLCRIRQSIDSQSTVWVETLNVIGLRNCFFRYVRIQKFIIIYYCIIGIAVVK